MDELTQIEVRFKPESAEILPAEVALLETMLPEIIRAMIAAEELPETN